MTKTLIMTVLGAILKALCCVFKVCSCCPKVGKEVENEKENE